MAGGLLGGGALTLGIMLAGDLLVDEAGGAGQVAVDEAADGTVPIVPDGMVMVAVGTELVVNGKTHECDWQEAEDGVVVRIVCEVKEEGR